MVRLKAANLRQLFHSLDCFNSKMVRLKVRDRQARRLFTLFQFQNGAVKSKVVAGVGMTMIKFQFQNGAVKSQYLPHLNRLKLRFNSKMVRLKAN